MARYVALLRGGRATQSRLTRVASMPIYQQMTIRNRNRMTTLLQLLDETGG